MDIKIRAARPEDAPAVVRLVREMADADGETTPLTERYAAQSISSGAGGVLLAEIIEEALFGFFTSTLGTPKHNPIYNPCNTRHSPRRSRVRECPDS